MGLTEKDPRDTSYIALYVAINWYCYIPSDVALRIAHGRSHMLPGRKLTPEILSEIKKIIDSPNFYNINSLVKKYRINKYDIYQAVGWKNANEEVITVAQTEKLLKRIKELAENCTAVDCEKCPLDKIMCGEYTLCEILSDTNVDNKGRLEVHKNSIVHQKCTKSALTGEIKSKGFKVYQVAMDKLEEYRVKHDDEKIQDIVSLALLEYIENRK